jgi:ubiquinone/menaquinone biosynthesis C-methylase UbiE
MTWNRLMSNGHKSRNAWLLSLSYGKTLEIGPGQGVLTIQLLNNGIDVVGVDIDRRFIKQANDMFRVNGIGTTIYQGDVCGLDFDDNTFDTSICAEVLEHLQYPQIAINELAAVTRKYVYITVPDKGVMPPETTKGHIQDFSAIDIFEMLKVAGLEIKHCAVHNDFIYAIGVKL